MKKPINEIKKMQLLAGLITESEYQKALMNEDETANDIVVKWTKKYLDNEKKDPYFYTEKGLADGFKVIGGQKVKEIIGYDEDDNNEVIGHIYSKSKKDIETEYNEDDLDNAFTNALNSSMTESEHQESVVNEGKNIPDILRKWKAAKVDLLDYQTAANLIEVGRIPFAAKFILEELDTSIREMIMDIIKENDPKLFDEMFGSEGY